MFAIKKDTSYTLSQAEQTRIDNTWEVFTAWRKEATSDTLCRVLNTDKENVYVGHDVTYKDVVGLRWQQSIPSDTPPVFQVLSAIAIVHTSDKQLVLLERNSGDWSKSLECSGGFVRAKYMDAIPFSIDSFIAQRVIEDLELPESIPLQTAHLGTYDARNILEHMLVYAVTLSVDAKMLTQYTAKARIMPSTYTPQNHETYSKLPLHKPSSAVLQQFQKL